VYCVEVRRGKVEEWWRKEKRWTKGEWIRVEGCKLWDTPFLV